MRHRVIRRLETILAYLILIPLALWLIFPMGWIFLTSLKPSLEATAWPPTLIFQPTVENYISMTRGEEFSRYFLNSLLIAASSTLLAILLGAPASYALTRFHFKGRNLWANYLLASRMAPAIVALIPYFMIFRHLKLYDTYRGMILVHLAMNLPLVVWMLRGFFVDLPDELADAALVDGCTNWGAFFRIMLPLVVPGIAAVAILAFLFSWNELLFAMTLTGINTKTAPAAMSGYIRIEEVAWGPLAAAATTALIPVLVLVAIVQRQLLRGLTFGAVKG
jgi:multiple sugar transport system permease protein